jgi:hypothetical protein
MPDNSKRTGAAIEAHYQFITWLLPAVEKSPRSQKCTIGDRISAYKRNPRTHDYLTRAVESSSCAEGLGTKHTCWTRVLV